MTKKKRGRKKKRGPKKRLPPKIYKGRNTWDYKIVSCRNLRQKSYIGKYASAKDAYSVVEQLLKESASVVFKKKLSNGEECINEYLILERKKGEKQTLLRNEYGKLVEHKTNTNKWIIFDKFRYDVEETFWVYGYDPRYVRKTFMWVYENIITNIGSKYDIKRLFVYNNKLIIKNDRSEMDIVFCKNRSDAIRFYNMVVERVKIDKISQVFFGGAYGGSNKRTTKLVDEICEYTGWDRKKVIRTELK